MNDNTKLMVGAGLGFALGAVWYFSRRGKARFGVATPSMAARDAGSLVTGSYSVPDGFQLPDLSSKEAFFGSLSTNAVTRSQQIYEAIKTRPSALETPTFVDVVLPDFNGHTGIARVTSDAVKLFGVRVNIDQYFGQLVTDVFGGVPMTRKVANAVYQAASYTPDPTVYAQLPGLRPALADMSTTQAMLLHSQLVDEKLSKLGDDGSASNLRANLGKDWLLNGSFWMPGTNGYPYCGRAGMSGSVPLVHTSVNYGWWSPGTSVSSPIQGAANCHDYHHSDYSQVLRFLDGSMTVDGETRNTADVIMDPELAGLLIDEAALKGFRHPGVPLDDSAPGAVVEPIIWAFGPRGK